MPRHGAIPPLVALFVVFLWATSFILAKRVLQELGPLTLAAVRYALGALCLAGFGLAGGRFRGGMGAAFSSVAPLGLRTVLGLGVAGYALNQGGVAVALFFLPASTAGVYMNVSITVQVLLFGVLLLREVPTPRQLLGVALALAGGVLFGASRGGYPVSEAWAADPAAQRAGIAAVLVTGASYAAWLNGSRAALAGRRADPWALTLATMAAGTGALLPVALVVDGWPRGGPAVWAIIGWLAAVNTALAFALWSWTQRHLAAYQSSVLNSTLPLQVALLAWLILGEPITPAGWAGIALASLGVLLTQGRKTA